MAVPDLPALVASVVNESGRVAPTEAVPLGTADAVVASAAALDGCWAHMSVTKDVVVPSVGTFDVQAYEVDHFDAAAGTFRREALLRNEERGVYVLMVEIGTYSMPEPGVLVLDLAEFYGSHPVTGELEVMDTSSPRQDRMRARWSGDRLLLAAESTVESEGEEAPAGLFDKVDCP
jgi:hypothetical protein